MTLSNTLPAPDDGWAMFLDVDGTLIEIADEPDGVVVDPAITDILLGLERRFGHALALVSGRPIAALDNLFAPLRPIAAGLHGLERRTADGDVFRPNSAVRELDYVRERLRGFAREHPRLLVEDKGLTVALHFRRAPDLEQEATYFADELSYVLGDRFVLQRGKMVLEFRPHGPHKGDVVQAYMAGPPFAGRTPVFIGDDVTDEDGFAAVNQLHGHSIRVGTTNATVARWWVAGVDELRNWLRDLSHA